MDELKNNVAVESNKLDEVFMQPLTQQEVATGLGMDFSKTLTKMPKFQPLKQYHDLCVAKLVKVEVLSRDIVAVKEDGSVSTYEFAGKTIPRLVFTFHNHILPNIDEVEREFVKSYDVISFQSEADGGKPLANYELVYKGMFEQLQHMMQYYMSKNKALTVPQIPSINPSATTDMRIEQFANFFTAVANWFNAANAGKPAFLDLAGKYIISALKLIAISKTNGQGTTYKALDFPLFLKEGFIATFKALTVPPSIGLSGNETVVLSKTVVANAANQPDNSIPNTADLSPEVRAAMGLPPIA
jgi:hypothetical protein